jgi:hypothetical protein
MHSSVNHTQIASNKTLNTQTQQLDFVLGFNDAPSRQGNIFIQDEDQTASKRKLATSETKLVHIVKPQHLPKPPVPFRTGNAFFKDKAQTYETEPFDIQEINSNLQALPNAEGLKKGEPGMRSSYFSQFRNANRPES